MATPVTTGHSIVIVGAWNSRIFSPPWVAANLTTNPAVSLAVAVDSPGLPIRLQFDGVYLFAGPERLLLSPVELSDPALNTMQRIAITILERLPHTPLSGIGVNFQLLEEHPAGRLLELFDLADNNDLSDFGTVIRTTSIKRLLALRDTTLNLSLDLREDGNVVVDFNFHRDVADAGVARAHLERGVLNYRDLARELSTSVYDIN